MYFFPEAQIGQAPHDGTLTGANIENSLVRDRTAEVHNILGFADGSQCSPTGFPIIVRIVVLLDLWADSDVTGNLRRQLCSCEKHGIENPGAWPRWSY